DQRRLWKAPAGHHFSVPGRLKVLGPDFGAVGGIEAGDFAAGGDGVEAIAVEAGRAARAGIAVLGDRGSNRLFPQQFAVGSTNAYDGLARRQVSGCIDTAAGDRDAGVAAADSLSG